MTFDVAIMNPPYNRTIHVKFLSLCVKISNTTVSIQPISFIQNAALDNDKINDIYFDDIEVITVSDTIKYFDAHIRNELGIITAHNGQNTDIRKLKIFDTQDEPIIYKCIEYACTHDTMYEHLKKTPDNMSLKFTDGAPLFGHAKIVPSSFRLCPMDYRLACSKEKTGFVKYLNDIPNENIRRNIFEFYNSVYLRYYYWKCCLAQSKYKYIPFLMFDRFEDRWTDDDYKEFFISEISLNEDEWAHYYNEANKLPIRK